MKRSPLVGEQTFVASSTAMKAILLLFIAFYVVEGELLQRLTSNFRFSRENRNKLQTTKIKQISLPTSVWLRAGANGEVKKKAKSKGKKDRSPVKSPKKKAKAEPKETKLEDIVEINEEEDADGEEGEIDIEMGQKKNNMFAFATDALEKTPPLTKLYLLSSIAITTASFFLNKNQWPSILHFDWNSILFKFQWWRIVSAFLFLGQLDLFYPLTLQFVWQHMGQLEKLSCKKPDEFFVMTVFGALSLIAVYTLTGVSTKFLGHNLATFFVYIWSRVFEGMDVNFMDIFVLKSEMLPWFFCAQTFLLEQEIPVADLIGIVVGHLYHYCMTKKVIKTPAFVQQWFAQDVIKKQYARFKEDFQ